MKLYDEFFKIISAFEKENVEYALVGGLAMAFHDNPRFTGDIDILVVPDQIEKIGDLLKNLDYFESAKPWKFEKTNITLRRFLKLKKDEHVILDILVGSEKWYEEAVKNSIKTPGGAGVVRVATKQDLIQMKKIRNSDQDRIDIQNLEND